MADNTFAIMKYQFFAFMILKYLYGKLGSFIPLFSGFDWVKYKSDIWYYFIPTKEKSIDVWYITYILIGIFVPILIELIIKYFKNKTINIMNNRKRKMIDSAKE